MIKQLNGGDIVTLTSACPIEGRIEAYYRAYGSEYNFCRFYYGDGVLAMLYCGELFAKAYCGADPDELQSFINCIPHFSLITDEYCHNLLADKLSGAEPLLYMRGSFDRHGGFSDYATEDYQAVYEVLSDAFQITDESDYGRWYTDTCHRVRHGVSKMLLLYDNGAPAASCTVLYDNCYGVFLSHIGVKRRMWGRGFGKRIISVAAGIYGDVTLLCEQDKRIFYEKCGLTCCGTAYKFLKNGENK